MLPSIFRQSFRHPFTLLAVTLTLLAITGCKSVTTTSIVGTPSAKDATSIEGIWKFEDTVLYAKALENGQFMFANIDWKENQWKTGQRIATVTTIGQHTLLYVGTSKPAEGADDSKPIKDQPDEHYMFFKLIYYNDKPDTLVAYIPNPDVFAKAIQSGKLKGDVERNSNDKVQKVAVTSTAQEFQAILEDASQDDLFIMKSPLVLLRVK